MTQVGPSGPTPMEKKMGNKLTQERLKELLEYRPETGEFTWRVPKARRSPGDPAGTPHNAGYVILKLDGIKYLRHRCAWLYIHGEWPPEQLDHVNGVRDDDRISNLRACTAGENQQNKRPSGRSGLLGVCWCRKSSRWKAQIKKAGVHRNLGFHDTKEQAYQAYLEAKKNLHTFNPTPRSQ